MLVLFYVFLQFTHDLCCYEKYKTKTDLFYWILCWRYCFGYDLCEYVWTKEKIAWYVLPHRWVATKTSWWFGIVQEFCFESSRAPSSEHRYILNSWKSPKSAMCLMSSTSLCDIQCLNGWKVQKSARHLIQSISFLHHGFAMVERSCLAKSERRRRRGDHSGAKRHAGLDRSG